MNGLYGYPSVGSTALGGLIADEEDLKSTLYEISTGAAAAKLNSQKKEILNMDEALNALREGFKSAPSGSKRELAWSKYLTANSSVIEVKSRFNRAVREHNDLAEKFNTYSLGAINPPRVGMAFAFIPAAIFAAAAAGIIYAVSDLVRQFRAWGQGGDSAIASSKGYIAQAGDALEQAGVPIRELGDLLSKGGSAALKVALAVGGVVAAVIAYQFWRDRRSSKAGADATPMLPVGA